MSIFIIQLQKGECVWTFYLWSGNIYDEFFNSGEEKRPGVVEQYYKREADWKEAGESAK